ncbi:type I secretion system permease/ATPase [Pontixanthobacter gangjinensis]|uniref:Type I secretion system permease/ATPase n=1 Tax=Pontixanthobacter gangjinensis TaxID=1028742 RepID=A0A6I4SSH4_9SPHN|nr:type I secretion system permease/ATPase [Pontixanthobacter gangjinensis]MXO57927.1 type I secretion system permease/ATPase [Pontixanthobacter gangjinensis]
MLQQTTEVDSVGDPLVAAIAELANRFGLKLTKAHIGVLARSADGYLPFHQAEAAIEAVGMNFQPRLGSSLSHKQYDYPALVLLENNEPAVLHELADGDLLVWKPGLTEPEWLPFAGVANLFSGKFLTVTGDSDNLREGGTPWYRKGRNHWFWSEIHKEKRSFRPVLLASLMINVLALALPLFSMNVYDRVIPNRTVSTLWVLAVGVLLAFALEFALRTARANVVDHIGRRLDLKLSQKIFGRLLATPLSAKQGHTGSIAARVSEYAMVRDFFASTTIVLMVDMAFLVLFVAAIAYIAGWLAIVPIIAITVMAISGFILQRKVTEAAQDAQADYGLQQTLLVEALSGMETLKSLNSEGGMVGQWRRLAEVGTLSQQKLKKINAVAVGLASSFQQISSISLVIGGFYLFDAGKITMGAIIAIVMISSRSLAPAGQLAFILTRARQAKETLTSIEGLFDADDERRFGSSSLPAELRTASIKMENMEFSYPGTATPALQELNLAFEPGERVAIIGRVASGKSTLGRIVCGLYRPTGGSMMIDGIDSNQYQPQDIRDNFCFVGQDAGVFTGSIKDNLTLGRADVSDEALNAALRNTGADQFLSRDAGGFDRAAGEHGSQLSGGQRSFLALARAFVKPSKLLFLDEPTGAMDSQTEKLFVERLSASLAENQTLLISTHRPALLSVCDRIIVLDNGRVIADGPKATIGTAAGIQLQ